MTETEHHIDITQLDNQSYIERLRRRPSRLSTLSTNAQKLDIRAHQRTYQGAYIRSCIGALTFSIIILKLFSKEFLNVGFVYTIYGFFIFIVSLLRSKNIDLYFLSNETKKNFKDDLVKFKKRNENENEVGNYQLANDNDDDETANLNKFLNYLNQDDKVYFKTTGNIVLFLTILSIGCYLTIFILLLKV
ncbi:unnamed protein product [[Candida] boidinii]|uniref:Unnamed protein product n=1 Tax=Candida boidinii TaxID=5477 RepID=A0A9W6SVS9_CANBO|nr:hypothetical protein B5S30_g5121 [[Candida] boidinii]OWB82214.1 hypothetical protein B5S33_g838 [[Candida] boidinii]GME67834.1 unnamed protein product [[Candida] boidinii]GMG11672.1 unnamed protein product [[Candida] boidinii]